VPRRISRVSPTQQIRWELWECRQLNVTIAVDVASWLYRRIGSLPANGCKPVRMVLVDRDARRTLHVEDPSRMVFACAKRA
jgi:hypothetical protein